MQMLLKCLVRLAYCLGIFLMLPSCSDHKFHVDAEIAGAADSLFVLQRPDFNGRWVTVDTVRAGNAGRFRFAFDAPASPEVVRVGIGSRFVYIPVDSTEHFRLSGSLDAFPGGVELTGSERALRMSRFEKEADAMAGLPADSLELFKRRVYASYIREGKADALSFHVLGKMIDGRPLFDPDDPRDAKYYSAVATAFMQYRPDDPRTGVLKRTALRAQQARNRSLGREKIIEATSTGLIDIRLPDVDGRERALSELTANGRPTMVVFSNMTDGNSPAINRVIAGIHAKGNVDVYQVSLDADRNAWREAARAIPWVSVFDPMGSSSVAVAQYNVTALPAVFIYNRKGELVSRPKSFADAEKQLLAL